MIYSKKTRERSPKHTDFDDLFENPRPKARVFKEFMENRPIFNRAKKDAENLTLKNESFRRYHSGVIEKLDKKDSEFVFELQRALGAKTASVITEAFRGGSNITYKDAETLARVVSKVGLNTSAVKEYLPLVRFYMNYSMKVGHDYYISNNLYKKLRLAFDKPLSFESFEVPNSTFFLNMEDIGFDVKFTGLGNPIFRAIDKGKLPESYFKFAVESGASFNFLKGINAHTVNRFNWRKDFINESATFRCIGAMVQVTTPLDSTFIPLATTVEDEPILLVTLVFENKETDDIEFYPHFTEMKFIRGLNGYFSDSKDGKFIPKEGSSISSIRDFFGENNEEVAFNALNTALYSILYLSSVSAEGNKDSYSLADFTDRPRSTFRKKIKGRAPRQIPLEKEIYSVSYIDNEGLPESWGIEGVEVSEEEAKEASERSDPTERTVYERPDDFYVEPHVRRGFTKRAWVTEDHPRFSEATIVQEREFRGIVKVRGLITIEIGSTEINPDKPSKYEVRKTVLR